MVKVILMKSVKKIGEAGDIVDVADGYGRNYLLPKGLAVEATEGNLKRAKEEKQEETKKKEKEKEAAQKIANLLKQAKFTITTKAGENGKLFGSITSKDIADIVKKEKEIVIDKRKIGLPEPIRELGNHIVKVKIHPEVEAQITVTVKAE